MRKLYYAGGYLIVSDQGCKAVLRYARALAINNIADVVTIESISDERRKGLAHLLIGPASQLYSTPTEDLGLTIQDADTVRDLEQKTTELQPHRPVWTDEMEDIPATDAYDFL